MNSKLKACSRDGHCRHCRAGSKNIGKASSFADHRILKTMMRAFLLTLPLTAHAKDVLVEVGTGGEVGLEVDPIDAALTALYGRRMVGLQCRRK